MRRGAHTWSSFSFCSAEQLLFLVSRGLRSMALETSFKTRVICWWGVSRRFRIMAFKTLLIILRIKVDIRRIGDRWPIHAKIVAIGAAGG